MAKVYSWEVSKNPNKYAYIVSPKDYTKAYVGNELKGENLEIVKNWTSSCSDEEYEAQFEKMVTLCQESGYNVTFESVASYLNASAVCDNLRGPSGRGVKSIIVEKRNDNDTTGILTINYDDNSSEIVYVSNFYAQDGKDGRDGSDGRDGNDGVSSKLVMIYTSGENGTPNTPEGGSYNFDTNELVCPEGWSRNDNDIKPPIFISTGTFTDSELKLSTNVIWDKPIQITGDKGEAGVDGISTEFIYCRTKIKPQKPTENDKTISGFVPNGWKASPEGINEDNPTEWVCIRNFNKELNEWGDWEGPNLWANFGVNGQDGDGIQYIYYKTEKDTPPDNPTPQDYKNIYHLYQEKNLEWVPGMDENGKVDYKNITSYLNIDGIIIYENIMPVLDNNDKPIAYAWTDNPTDVSVEYQYQWVSSRKYRTVDGKKIWDKFSKPVLWGKFSENGVQGPQGPAGEPGAIGGRGATGLPGVSYINVYCLGTEDIYFGTNDFINKKEEDLKNEGWCGPENIPSTQINSFDLNNLEEKDNYNNFIENENNLNCVFKKKEINSDEYVYYILNELNNPIELKEINENIIIKDDFLYLWCTQGIEKFTKQEGDEDIDISTITWGNPFRLQGVNGLKGTDGSRGQVVYPMGSYNPNEVYITTEQKAPYVYDPSDGEFYVLNVVNKPWVGKLPENYQTIKKDDGTYKYSLTGLESGPWITDKDEQTPSENYTENEANDETSAWVKFESFQALYTSIGIIANGMIGSAVYNNEFMFSQQGCDSEGNDSNFAYEKGGFLSAYYYDEKGEVDENGNKTGRHWMYGDEYINDTDVNPYAKDENGNYIHNFIPNICLNFKTGQMWTSRGQVYNGPTTSSLGDLSILVENFKSEVDGFKSETETNIENITKKIESVSEEASDVQESLNELSNELSKSLEDGYLSKDEQVRMENKLDDLEVQFNELKSEHEDLINNEYLKGNKEDKTTPKGKLQGIFNSLSESHDKFKIEIEKLLNVNFEDDNTTYKVRTLNNDNTFLRKYKVNLDDYFSNDLGWEYKYADGDWNWGDDISKDKKPGFKDYQIKYEKDLQNYITEVLIAQNFIQEEIKNSIQVGGVNLIEFSKLENNGYLNFTKRRPKITVEYNKDDIYSAIQLPNYSVIKKGYEYVLSFNFKKISGTISKIGMPLKDTECENVQIYIDNTLYSLNTGLNVGFTVDYTADNNEHKVIIKFKTKSEVQYQTIIQFNRNVSTAFEVEISNIQLEIGNVATEYKPNDADIIEARENILKGGMLFTYVEERVDQGDTNLTLVKEIKSNTEYVLSVENISTTGVLYLYGGEGIDYITELTCNKGEKSHIIFTTNKNIKNGVWIESYDSNITFYGIKIAEGNKYTPWEGTADEQKTLIMLNNAMQGTTDINGGLMLTNTIGMKGSATGTTITAGINGLNSGVSGMTSDLRFWAGSKTWGNIQSAPFRVYDDGRVFGTHFYGFDSFLSITDENYSEYTNEFGQLIPEKTGGKIILETSGNVNLNLPDGLEYLGTEIEILNPCRRKFRFCTNATTWDHCSFDTMFELIGFGTENGLESYYHDHNGYKYGITINTCTSAAPGPDDPNSPLWSRWKMVVIDSNTPGYNNAPYKESSITTYAIVGGGVTYTFKYFWCCMESIL